MKTRKRTKHKSRQYKRSQYKRSQYKRSQYKRSQSRQYNRTKHNRTKHKQRGHKQRGHKQRGHKRTKRMRGGDKYTMMTALAKLERQPYGAKSDWIRGTITDADGTERQIYDYEIDEYDPVKAAKDQDYYNKTRYMIYLTPEDHALVQADPKLKKEYMKIFHNVDRLTNAEKDNGVKQGKGMYMYVRLTTPEYLVDNAKPKDKIKDLHEEEYNSLDETYKAKVVVYGWEYYKLWPKRTPEELVEEINGLTTSDDILLTKDEYDSLKTDVQSKLRNIGGIYYKNPSAEEEETAANIKRIAELKNDAEVIHKDELNENEYNLLSIIGKKYVDENFDKFNDSTVQWETFYIYKRKPIIDPKIAINKKEMLNKKIENGVKELTEEEYNLLDEDNKQLFEVYYSYGDRNDPYIEKYVRKIFGPAEKVLTTEEEEAAYIADIISKINAGEPQRLDARDYEKLPKEYKNYNFFMRDPKEGFNPDYISTYKRGGRRS